MSTAFQKWPPEECELPQRHAEAPEPGTALVSHFTHCFGCGDEQEHGLHLRSTAGEGHTARSTFVVTEAHQGAPGLAHGGLLACAFDEAIGAAVGHLLRQPAVTGRLETDFVRPVPVGSTLHITSRISGVTGRKVYTSADGRLNAPDGPIAVRARALFVIVDFRHFIEHGRQEEDPAAADQDPGGVRARRYDINP